MLKKIILPFLFHFGISCVYSFVGYWYFLNDKYSSGIGLGYQQPIMFAIHFFVMFLIIGISNDQKYRWSFTYHVIGFFLAIIVQYFGVGIFVETVLKKHF